MDAHLKHDTKVASFIKTATRAPREALGKVGRKYTYCDEIAMSSAIDLKRVARKINYFRVDVELTGSYTRRPLPNPLSCVLRYQSAKGEIVLYCICGKHEVVNKLQFELLTSLRSIPKFGDLELVKMLFHTAHPNYPMHQSHREGRREGDGAGQVVVDWLDVLWTKDEAGFVAAQGKDQVGKLPFVKFVASCNANVVDTWMNNAVLQKPGPW
ncbi:unnamed protein product [Cylicostephanus goldi]|uniref:Uncharacterized protein n=1 Tax=Cylicostephanus goldi TaxID=71465 RepID=A0A3P6QX70_CYLGO|nr:unnamed protein product [Cylicostephanus goldi]